VSLLHDAGYSCQVSPITTAAGKLFRVRIGPLASQADADRILAKVQHEGYPGARRTSE
jgi:DedD protein